MVRVWDVGYLIVFLVLMSDVAVHDSLWDIKIPRCHRCHRHRLLELPCVILAKDSIPWAILSKKHSPGKNSQNDDSDDDDTDDSGGIYFSAECGTDEPQVRSGSDPTPIQVKKFKNSMT